MDMCSNVTGWHFDCGHQQNVFACLNLVFYWFCWLPSYLSIEGLQMFFKSDVILFSCDISRSQNFVGEMLSPCLGIILTALAFSTSEQCATALQYMSRLLSASLNVVQFNCSFYWCHWLFICILHGPCKVKVLGWMGSWCKTMSPKTNLLFVNLTFWNILLVNLIWG